uniref:Secreted protein n=1 Tax=Ditylenchus dipsaci TaxID=166011 RepID=A0A915EDW2_9BILA
MLAAVVFCLLLLQSFATTTSSYVTAAAARVGALLREIDRQWGGIRFLLDDCSVFFTLLSHTAGLPASLSLACLLFFEAGAGICLCVCRHCCPFIHVYVVRIRFSPPSTPSSSTSLELFAKFAKRVDPKNQDATNSPTKNSPTQKTRQRWNSPTRKLANLKDSPRSHLANGESRRRWNSPTAKLANGGEF